VPPRGAEIVKLLPRVRRRLARWAAPELERELQETRRKLRATRKKLKRAEAELRDVHGQPDAQLPERVNTTIESVRAQKLSYLKLRMLRDLAEVVLEIERDGVRGLFVEAGAARGGSAIVIAAAKAPDRPMKVYDVFGMIPPPSAQDGPDVHARYAAIAAGEARGPGGETYYGYRDELYEEVLDAFARHGLPVTEHNIELVRGLFEDTLHLDEPVAFAHLDGDWYESTMTCLTRIAPLLSTSGRMVVDDYYKWSGCRRAVDEYFSEREGFRLEHRTKLHVVRD
jgi:hypothetical protein